jgi:hypothetical protein
MRAVLLHRSTLATLAILAALGAYWLHGWSSGARKLAALGPLDAEGGNAIAATLSVPPEKFHMEIMQGAGRLVAVKGREIALADVPARSVERLARHYWVTAIRLGGPAAP